MTGETFGAMLKRLRLATMVPTPVQRGNWSSRIVQAPMSQNELASRAEIDPAYVNRMECARPTSSRRRPHVPSQAVVESLARALGLDPTNTDRLLIAAGYWPWTADEAEAVIRFVREQTDVYWRRTG